MAQYLSKAGFILQTNDKDKIEVYKAKGLKEVTEEPQPPQDDIKPEDEFIVRKAKKPVKKGKKGV